LSRAHHHYAQPYDYRYNDRTQTYEHYDRFTDSWSTVSYYEVFDNFIAPNAAVTLTGNNAQGAYIGIQSGMDLYIVSAFGRNTVVTAFGSLGTMSISEDGGISFSNPTAGAFAGEAVVKGIPFGGIMFYTEKGEKMQVTGLGDENIIYTVSSGNVANFQKSFNAMNIKSNPLTLEQAQLLADVYSSNSYSVIAGYGYDGNPYTFGYINAPWYMYVAAGVTIAGEGFAAGYNKGKYYSNEGLSNHYGSLPSGTAMMWSNYFGLKTFNPWW
jgi:hypothetical protein